MARRPDDTIRPPERLAAGILLIVSGSVSLYLTMQAQWAASALGPICGHSGAFALHCPACYAAAAMIAAGLALGVSATRRSWMVRVRIGASPNRPTHSAD